MKNKKANFGILIVDDDKSSLDSLYRSLARLEYMVYRCSVASLVEEMIIPFKIKLLLTDIRMPDISGFELAKQLLGDFPELVIYAYTGFYRESFEHEGRESGIKKILPKPLDIRELNNLIEQELMVTKQPIILKTAEIEYL